jgi:type VI protein secretion system component VasK
MINPNGNDALSHLLQQSRLLPEPLQTWHTSIATESWRILLKNTENFLNRIWIATVYPQYEALLDQRYPLFKEATTEIALTDFTNFFGSNGVMDSFFKNHLEPFIDNSRLYWEWKNIDGQKLAIPQTTLEMFIRAALIEKMFFSENTVRPSITFSLVPAEFDPKLSSFSLNLEGQVITYQKDNEQIISMTWPGPQPNHTQVTLIDDKGKRSDVIETGPWSWFRLLDKCQLESTNNPKHFKLSLDLNGYMAHYELYTNGVVNPYLPGILNAFRCPPSL